MTPEATHTVYYAYRYRYYWPRIGRFLSPDPAGLRGGVNPYLDCPNPYNNVDPFGLAFANGILTINPICGWSDEQHDDAKKKMEAMN